MDWLFKLNRAGYFIFTGHAASTPIVGPDTSNWQAFLDAGTAYSQGYRFQIIKATEGLTFQDAHFATSLANAKQAKIIPGAYHFLHRGSGADQADYFINYVKANNGGKTSGVAYMVDVETYGSTYPTYTDVTDFVARFKRLVLGRTLILYTGEWFWGSSSQAGPPPHRRSRRRPYLATSTKTASSTPSTYPPSSATGPPPTPPATSIKTAPSIPLTSA